MKTNPDPATLKKVSQIQRWVNDLDRIAHEMRCASYPHLAHHADSIAADLSFEQAQLLEINGPLVWKF